MAFNVTDFTSQLTYEGARPNLFNVRLANPIDPSSDQKFEFMCKATSLPGSTMGVITSSYFGRTVNFAGNRTYESWSVTIINDEDFLIRNAMESWMTAINSPEGNLRAPGLITTPKTDAYVTQYGKGGDTPLREVQMINLFPTAISAIELGWESNDAIEEFTVDFSIDYWIVSGGITGNAGGR